MKFTKTAKSFPEQITLLKERGLRFEDERHAEFYLNNISYYRLSAYFLSFQKYGDPTHKFMPWATFGRVMDLYIFDREFRAILLDAIERIEVAIRCRIVYEYCHTYGTNWYENSSLFIKNHSKFMGLLNNELENTKEIFIKHYFNKYTDPKNPPAWMAIELLSFGQLSTMFKNLKSTTAKKSVSIYFGVSPAVLESWLEHLVYIRNLCAHHSRLWNRVPTVKAMASVRPTYRWIKTPPANKDKIYTTLCISAYLLQRVTKRAPFTGRLMALLARFPEVDIKAAGLPKDWDKDIFWSKIPVALTYKLRIWYFTLKSKIRKKKIN